MNSFNLCEIFLEIFKRDKINYRKEVVPAAYAENDDIGIKARLCRWFRTGGLKIKSIISAKMARIPIIPIQRYYRDIERKNAQIVELNHIYNFWANNENVAGVNIQKEESEMQDDIKQYKIANSQKDEYIRNKTISIDVFRDTIIDKINNFAKDKYYREMYLQYLTENSCSEIVGKALYSSKKSLDEVLQSFNLSFTYSDYWILLGGIYYTEDNELAFAAWDFRTGPPDEILIDLAVIPTKVLHYVFDILQNLPPQELK